MNNAKYFDFYLMVSIDGVVKFFDHVWAISLESALADIAEAYCGEVLCIQYQKLG